MTHAPHLDAGLAVTGNGTAIHRRKAPWDQAEVVRSNHNHLCLVDAEGFVLAMASSATQLLDAIHLGVGEDTDRSSPVSCALKKPWRVEGCTVCDCTRMAEGLCRGISSKS